MDGRVTVLVLAYLFQKMGSPISLEKAVDCLSFDWRYGPPSAVRRMLSAAQQNGMISRQGNMIEAGFLYDKQVLDLQVANKLRDSISVDKKYEPMC